MESTFSPHLLPREEASVSADRLTLGVRLPWYRALPLSVAEVGSLSVDGVAIPAEQISLTLNGHRYRLDQVPEQVDEWWFTLDSAQLDVAVALDPSVDHHVAIQMKLYPPYIPGLTWVTDGQLTIQAQ
jgi:Domain of unknown function (DUF6379)